MCLAVAGKILKRKNHHALVDVRGSRVEVDISLVPNAGVNDYVLVHAGFAIERLDESEAQETLKLFRDLARALDDDREGNRR